MDRRAFLSATVAAAAAAPLGRSAASASSGQTAERLIDTNVTLSAWPVRRSPFATPAALVKKLRQHGVTSAWVGSFEAVLNTDVAGVNAELAEACAREGAGVLRAFGTVNLALPDWEDDVRRCHEVHRMPGLRLFPNYHGYTLADPRFAQLLDLAAKRRLLVQIVMSIEDERGQNPVLAVPPVAVAPLADTLAKVPGARVMLLNTRAFGAPVLQRLVPAGVLFEIATIEIAAGLEALLQKTPTLRLAFGSHTPFYYFEAALLKLQESALTPAQLTAIRHSHAAAALYAS